MILPRIVGIAGRKQHGKDTAAQALLARGYVRQAFADPLKQMALDLDPIVDVYDTAQDTLERERLSEVVQRIDWERAKEEYPEVRRTLQRLGTDVMRKHFGPEVWVDLAKWARGAAGDPLTVFTDCRFLSEVKWIRNAGGVVVRVVNPRVPRPDVEHESEAALDDVNLPVVVNDGSIEQLHLRLGEVLDTLVVCSPGVFTDPHRFQRIPRSDGAERCTRCGWVVGK